MQARTQKRPIQWYGWLMILFLGFLFAAGIGVFAWQTWEFVNFLLPSENWFMKDLAVANFDVMSLIWLFGELLLRNHLTHGSKVTMTIAGGIDLFFSGVATILQLTVVAAIRFNTYIDPKEIYTAYGIIAFVLLVNIISFLVVIRQQWPYIIGDEFYSPSVETEVVRKIEENKKYSPSPAIEYSPNGHVIPAANKTEDGEPALPLASNGRIKKTLPKQGGKTLMS